MELRELIYKLRKYPKVLVQFIRDVDSPYLSIHQLSRMTGLDYRAAKDYMYDMMADNIIDKYQTTFRLSKAFLKQRINL